MIPPLPAQDYTLIIQQALDLVNRLQTSGELRGFKSSIASAISTRISELWADEHSRELEARRLAREDERLAESEADGVAARYARK